MQNPYLKKLRDEATRTGTAPGLSKTSGIIATEPDVLLSDEAKELLLTAAADKAGHIMKLAYIGGQHIQAGGRQFGGGADRRIIALWEYALEQLEQQKLVEALGDKRQIFGITKRGYEVADRLKLGSAGS